MRFTSLPASFAAGCLGVLALSAPAAAFGDLLQAPEGYAHPHRDGLHRKLQYNLGSQEDPYAYRYAARKYYPYSGSHYWVPAAEMKYRYRYGFSGPKYVYYPAWGYTKHSPSHGHTAHGARPTK